MPKLTLSGADAASALWAAIEQRHGRGLVPAHGVTTIFYLLERARDAAFARDRVERLVRVFTVAAVDGGGPFRTAGYRPRYRRYASLFSSS